MAPDFAGFFQLLCATCDFHWSNLIGTAASSPDSVPQCYSLLLAGCPRRLWLRPRSGDIFIFHEVFATECYRIPPNVLSTATVVVDLGANIGLTTTFLAERFPEARFVCVEPSPSNVAILRRNLAWMGDRASIVEAAVSDRRGEISFDDGAWSWGGHILTGDPAGSRRVRCETVDSILAAAGLDHVDLLKVDIEGAESMIFSARPEWLRTVKCVIIELHPGYSTDQLQDDLRPFGFEVLPPDAARGNEMIMAVRP
jgi:FkbM family methyltransferase